MTQAPDYHELVQRKNAISLFDAYLQVFDLMTQMEPKLFKTAVRTIKQHKKFKIDMKTLRRLKRLYPEHLPNVFSRLWVQEQSYKESEQKNKIIQAARLAWRARLGDQGHLDEAAVKN